MELELVGKVELKLLLANTDEKFTSSLALFLPPLLQKLNSSVDVVTKVVEVLQFIKKRRRESVNIRLPFNKLMDMYFANVFDLTLISQNRQTLAFIALEAELSKPELNGALFANGLRLYFNNNFSVNEMLGLQFALFLLNLDQVDLSEVNELDLKVLKLLLPKFMLLNLKNKSQLSKDEFKFFENHFDRLNMTPQNDAPFAGHKRAVVALAERFPIILGNVLVAGMGDVSLDLSRKCRLLVMKMEHASLDFDFVLAQARFGNSVLRTNSMELLLRHKKFEFVDFDLVRNALDNDDLKLRQAALLLLRDTIKQHQLNDQQLFVNKLRQYIFDDGWPLSQKHSPVQTHLRQLCYELLGMMSSDQQIVNFLMQSLDRDSVDMASSIQKALSSVLLRGKVEIDNHRLLETMQFSNNHRSRYTAISFASKLQPTMGINRAIMLLGIDKTKNSNDVVMEAQSNLLATNYTEMPSFEEMLSVLNEVVGFKSASEETLEACVMYLLACLIKYPPSSLEWVADLRALLETTKVDFCASGEEDMLVYLNFLFSLVSLNLKFCEVLPLVLSKMVLQLSGDQLHKLVSKLDVNALRVSIQTNSVYAAFLAEYLPLLNIYLQFDVTNEQTYAYMAYNLVLHNKGDLNSILEHGNSEVFKVLASCGYLKTMEKLPSADSQLVKACVAMHFDLDERQKTLEQLFKSQPKSFDEIVLNGEAISVNVSGWDSKVLQNRYPYLTTKFETSKFTQLEEFALNKIVEGIRGSPESRRIASVRLLCLTQYSFYNTGEYSKYANGVQTCFMNLLSDHDDVTQEAASRGLSILFQNGDNNKNVQQNLLSSLLQSFTDDIAAKKNTVGTLTADTQVFEPGVLPTDPRGKSSISTYKDIMSLANETGDSSLVYKFMSLSSNSQIWTGRKGMAFSLQQIISKSEVQQQILNGSDTGNKLIPKLFRYLYDPVPVTKDAMKHIWTTLIPGPQRSKVIKHYFKLILDELLSGVIDRQWRVRQASCLALSDMISNGTLNGSVDILKIAFRAVDDIKESVSEAGKELLTSLSNALVRKSSKQEDTNDDNGSDELGEIIPFLVSRLNHKASAAFSLKILLKLSETHMFKHYAASVLTELVLQLSSFEPQALNYLAQHMGQREVDSARLSGLQQSPIMQAMESMVERGAPSNQEMWVLLPNLIKSSVGTPSKLAAARLLILTCLQTYGGEKVVGKKLLKLTTNEVFGGSEVCSDSYASAVGYLARHTPLNLVVEYINDLRSKFVNSEPDDEKTRYSMALALKKLSTNASDVFGSVANIGLPLAYVGKQTVKTENENDNKDLKASKLFKQVCDENTGGNASIKLYAADILKFASEVLETTLSRTLKVSAAIAIESVMDVLNDNSVHVGDELKSKVESTSKALKSSLVGRSWPNKEHIKSAYEATEKFINERK